MGRTINRDMMCRFELLLRENERSGATIEKYLRDVQRFLLFAGIGTEITKETAIAYKQWLKKHYEVSSANSMLAALNCFFRLQGWSDCMVRPYKMQGSRFRSEDRELSREEYLRLTQAAQRKGQTWLYLIMVTLGATGIRVSELLFITVEALATRRASVNNKGKTRQVILPVDLCRKLRAYACERAITQGSVFVTRTGRPIDRSNIHHAMKKLCAEAGVEPGKVFPHNLRHLFAVEHYEKNRDLTGLADILGHTNINTTRIYTMESMERRAEEISALGLVV